MNASQIITRKRDGHSLSETDIAAFIGGYVDGTIPDYQMAALAMAIFFQGMTSAETTSLTEQILCYLVP